MDTSDTSFTDPRDGQVYRIVKMPDGKWWMAENLNYKAEGSWCYGDDEANGKKYGRLYTWFDARTVSPAGWHLPSMEEWDELVEAAGGEEIAGGKLKSKRGWGHKGNGTDEFGFSALPGGDRFFEGEFEGIGDYGGWWSATADDERHAYYRDMSYEEDSTFGDSEYKLDGFSVRCVQDRSDEG